MKTYKLIITEEVEDTDLPLVLDHIQKLIEEGYMSGNSPAWEIIEE